MIHNLAVRIVFWILVLFGFSVPDTYTTHVDISSKPDHSIWDSVLQSHVDDAGQVDYAGLKKQPAILLQYLDHLSDYPPAEDWTRADSLAYYINLYNAATVKLILLHYPVSSIKDISNPWTSDVVEVGNDPVSLGYLEHRILRKMDEPKIHFAINCASYSCPKLWNRAFTAKDLETQLEQVTREFINDPKLNEYGETAWELSQIFNWYAGDFKSEGGVRAYIRRYTPADVPEPEKVSYKNYDWSLNDAGK